MDKVISTISCGLGVIMLVCFVTFASLPVLVVMTLFVLGFLCDEGLGLQVTWGSDPEQVGRHHLHVSFRPDWGVLGGTPIFLACFWGIALHARGYWTLGQFEHYWQSVRFLLFR